MTRSLVRLFAARAVLAISLLAPVVFGQTAPPQTSPQSKDSAKGKVGSGVEILTDTQGVDFSDYLRIMYFAAKKKWFEEMPPSVELGQMGTNCVQFRVLSDGKVPDEFIKLVTESREKELDRASLQAIRRAAPFSPLPEKFTGPYIELRYTFYYNVNPPKK